MTDHPHTPATAALRDAAALAACDEATLERHRRALVLDLDDERHTLIDHLMVRAMPTVARTTVRLADAAGLPRAATLMAGEEAAVTLLMRLHTPEPLAPITELARTVAAVAVRAHVTGTEAPADHASASAPDASPRLAHRRPALRVIEGGAA
jgi:hypothetical protein